MHTRRTLIPALAGLALSAAWGAVLVACSSNNQHAASTPPYPAPPAAPTQPTVTAPTLSDSKPVHLPGLHNVVAYHDNYYSGGVPESPEAFDTLKSLGIKTVISVDGAIPDVKSAEARGIRYIHLPIGYNGFDDTRRLELARATRDALNDGPVYIHCHHGKHRSAAAAAAAVTALGYMSADDAIARMKVSGTAPNYTGLYACVASTTALDLSTLNAVPADFPSVFKPADFVQAMLDLDEMLDHLTEIKNANWKTPADHPDLVPAAEAGRLADTLRILAESTRAKREKPGFAQALLDDAAEAEQLEDAITANADAKALDTQLKVVSASCKDCHAKYRD
ncbi:MAG TPA: cytochrome c [Phycisphaerales bacterium]